MAWLLLQSPALIPLHPSSHRIIESASQGNLLEPYNSGAQLPRPTDTQHLRPTDYPSWAPSRCHDLISSHESLKEKDSSDTSCGLHPHALPILTRASSPSPKNQSERLLVKLLMRQMVQISGFSGESTNL